MLSTFFGNKKYQLTKSLIISAKHRSTAVLLYSGKFYFEKCSATKVAFVFLNEAQRSLLEEFIGTGDRYRFSARPGFVTVHCIS